MKLVAKSLIMQWPGLDRGLRRPMLGLPERLFWSWVKVGAASHAVMLLWVRQSDVEGQGKNLVGWRAKLRRFMPS